MNTGLIKIQELGPRQRQLIAELRSGKYKQTYTNLHVVTSYRSGIDPVGYCCLGVASDICSRETGVLTRELVHQGVQVTESFNDEDSVLPPEVKEYFKFGDNDGGYNERELIKAAERIGWGGYFDRFMSLMNYNDDRRSFEFIATMMEEYPSLYFREAA